MTLLLDVTLKATILLGLAGLITALLARRSPALRHFVWTLAVIGVLLLPVLSVTLPRRPVPLASGLPGWLAAETPAGVGIAVPRTARAPLAEIIESALADEGKVAAHPAPQASAPSRGTVTTSAARAGVAVAGDRFEIGTPRTAFPWFGLLWGGGVLVLLAGFGGALARLRAMAREADPATDPAVIVAASRAGRLLGVSRPVRILYTADRAMPMTWGLVWPVLLLPRGAASWSSSRLDAVLMHELAHVKRLDYLTQLLARMVCALLWFHPLAWYAARRLRVERELACDDLVVRAGSRPSEYAGHLLAIAQSCRASRLASRASLPMACESRLGRRLGAVLDARRSRRGVGPASALAGVVVALVILVPLAAATPVRGPAGEIATASEIVAGGGLSAAVAPTRPAPSVDAAAPARPPRRAQQSQQLLCDWTGRGNSSTSTNIDDDHVRIRIERDRCRLELEADGEITFAEDYTDVTRIASSGQFTLEERAGGSRRELEIEPDGAGLVRRWRVDGDERPFDDAARQWLAEALLVVFRRTSYRAEERGTRILAQEGVRGLLDEIDLMTSGHAIAQYYSVLFALVELDPPTVERIVTQAAQRIESDHSLGQVLLAIAESQPLDESVKTAYMAAAGSIGSDYERRRVLSAMLERGDLSPEVAAALLAAASEIDSDHELSELLVELIGTYPVDRALTPAFLAAVGSLDSDYERGRVLTTLLERGAPDTEVLDAALELTEGMDSDNTVAELLLDVLRLYPPDRELPPSFVRAARRLDSDYSQGRVWAAVLEHPSASPDAIAAALEAAGQSIDSDHQRTELLLLAVHGYPIDDALRPAFFTALERTGSDYSRGRVLDAVIDQPAGTRETALAVLQAAGDIGSDHTLSEVLLHFASVVEMDAELRAAYRQTASHIGSDRTRERVLRPLGGV